MRVQRVVMPQTGRESWTVVEPGVGPVGPIEAFLAHLTDIGRSPNTVNAYAYGLAAYFDYLDKDWRHAGLEDVSGFVGSLRESKQLASGTVGLRLAAVTSFYDFHLRNGVTVARELSIVRDPHGPRRGLLSHVPRRRIRGRAISIRTRKLIPRTLDREEVQAILEATTRLRDRFLMALLYETGCRIGAALGLRHGDLATWDRQIHFIPREDNANGARFKGSNAYVVDVSSDLVQLYSAYMFNEYPEEIESDYVFVNLFSPPIGHALVYSRVDSIVRGLRTKTGIEFTPHMFRHTHATELLRAGVGIEIVAKRLNDAVDTVNETYAHLTSADMKNGLEAWWATDRAVIA